MKRLYGSFGVMVLLAGIVVGAAAAGGSTSVNGYGGVAGNIQSTVKSGGTLPFTGLDLGLIAAVAAAALVAGLVMRRLAHPRS